MKCTVQTGLVLVMILVCQGNSDDFLQTYIW